ncbi:hypothetical protein SELMODRAFT_169817 [Selaginella moellendorffii]|uniref:Alpha/beta hydrolase fold-3 domain-containing protein n=1 Tax=Selaginella moellendorffii TaxID=88036 RepID=D8RB62_SELML|nr:gibberellin receptor GID1C [Selaginella moellendorffii]EFJ30438.1 hypothetical protein SELMODRAFT_169817 [Selaginella moellendorffii]|eukprot:XP_002968184.1 gibberellin receptor GID1C [Selaginella moellendorffii]
MGDEERKSSGKQIGGFVFAEDGSYVRTPPPTGPAGFFAEVPANPSFIDGVASRDVILDKDRGLWVRVFRPEELENRSTLPIVIFYHGGGFIYMSAANAIVHRFCETLSRKLGAIVVSVNYRLAPEHRLPAAYDDGYDALKWVRGIAKSSSDQDAFAHADFSKIFVMGDSAGGNLAARVALRAAQDGIPLAGQILLQPFYGGTSRTESELKLGSSNPMITLDTTDFCWLATLPEGAADRDHPFCNPTLELPGDLARLGAGGLPRALVVVGGKDLLHDRQVEFARILEDAGNAMKLIDYENASHGFYAVGDASCQEYVLVLDEIASFLRE